MVRTGLLLLLLLTLIMALVYIHKRHINTRRRDKGLLYTKIDTNALRLVVP
jgi:flagellar biogenesis protein FliO